MEQQSYIKKEVADCLDIKPSQIQYYTDQGIVTPEIEQVAGKGKRNRYSRRNIMQILIVKKIVEHGIPLSKARAILNSIENWVNKSISLVNNTQDSDSSQKVEHSEAANFARMILENEWDFSTRVFLCVHEVFGNLLKVSFLLNSDPEKSLQIYEKISDKTISLIIINISDILQKMAEIAPSVK